MASCRFVFAGLLFLSLTTPLVAAAGQGDPRLITGVLEWPPTVTNEAFVIVRGDDGALYYIGVTSARRDVAPTANMRIAVLGIEGRSPYEITAAAFSFAPQAPGQA